MNIPPQLKNISFVYAGAWILIQTSTLCNLTAGMITARRLSPVEFGKLSAALAAAAILISFLNPIANEISRLTARYSGLSRDVFIKILVSSGISAAIVLQLPVFSIVPISISQISILAGTFVFLISSVVYGAMLNGANRVQAFGSLQIAGALSKLLFIFFVLDAASGFEIGLISYLIGFAIITAGGMILQSNPLVQKQELIRINPLVLGGFFLLALPYSIDQIFVQKCFPVLSGHYAAIAGYSKIIMLVSAPALTIGYAHILQHSGSSKKFQNKILQISGLVSLGALALALILFLLRNVLFTVLLGGQYDSDIPYILFGLLGMVFHVFSFGIFQSLLSVAFKPALWCLSAPVVLQCILFMFCSTGELQSLMNIFLATFLLQGLGALCSLYLFRRHSE